MALAKNLPIYSDIYKLSCDVFAMTKHFSTDKKPTLARRIEDTLLEMQDLVIETKLQESGRVALLQKLTVCYERLQFLINLSVHFKQMSYGQQAELARQMLGIGKQLTGWRLSVIGKENAMGSCKSTDT